MKRFLAILLAALMMFALTACGGKNTGNTDNKKSDPNLVVIGDHQALYKGTELTTDSDGDDAVIISFDYTNNSSADQNFSWAFMTTVKQGGKDMEFAVVFLDEESYTTYEESAREDVKPGETKEVFITYKLKDKETPIEIEFSSLMVDDTKTITIDVADL